MHLRSHRPWRAHRSSRAHRLWLAHRSWRAVVGGWAAATARALWFPFVLTLGTLLLDLQPEDRRRSWLAWLSTNLDNLVDDRSPVLHPIGALLGSGAVCERDLVAWVVLSVVGLAPLGHRIGAGAAAGLVVSVHVLATGASEGFLAVRVATGVEPESARSITDVGPSYLVVAALVAAVLFGHSWFGRMLAGLGFVVLAPSLFEGLTDGRVAAIGHLISIGLAAGLGAALVHRHDRGVRPVSGVG